MTGFLMFIHVIICVALTIVILMQSGRGGGLTEGFGGAESMFGAQTSEFLIKGTTIATVLFFVTSLSLAVISSQKGKSLMTDAVVVEETTDAVTQSLGEMTEAANEAVTQAEQAVQETGAEIEAAVETTPSKVNEPEIPSIP